VIAPQTLKKESCKLTYEPIEIVKKRSKKVTYEYKNNDGISGGKFTKKEMYKCITENKNYTCEWSELLREMESDVMSAKTIQKPMEDLNDCFILSKVIENNIK
jgi:hypothetical protein